MSTKEIPVEVTNTTIQIDSILRTIQERETIIDSLKNKRKNFEEPVQKFNAYSEEITELEKRNKDNRKLVETLVSYVKENYNEDFTPGTLFNQEQINHEQ